LEYNRVDGEVVSLTTNRLINYYCAFAGTVEATVAASVAATVAESVAASGATNVAATGAAIKMPSTIKKSPIGEKMRSAPDM